MSLAASALEVPAQRVHGVVTDATSNARLTGVLVTLMDGANRAILEATTDTTGSFNLAATQPGSYRLRISLIGYLSFTSDALDLAPREAVQVSVRLATQAIPLNPVVVVARRSTGRLADFERRRERHASGYFMGQSDIDKRPVAKASTLLMNIPGIRLQAIRRRGSTTEDRHVIQFSGPSGAPCVANVFIDGVQAQQSPVTIDELLDVAALGAVEVYPRAAGAPIEYQRSNNCGVVLFWTREVERVRRPWSWTKFAIGVGVVALAIVLIR
ncbi:MAG: carboxypeptidase regulatory-like domain-containing protein [Longimicrobiales bacterium]